MIGEPIGEPRPAFPVLRIIAYLLDGLLLSIVLVALADATGATTIVRERVAGRMQDVRTLDPWLEWTFFGLGHVYQIVGIAVFGTTVGRAVCGLRVRTEAGAAVGWGTSIARHAVLSVPVILSLALPLDPDLESVIGTAVLVGLIVPAFTDPARRGLHDRWVRTRVEHRSPIDALRDRFPVLATSRWPGLGGPNKMGERDATRDRRSKEE